jgi:hypothetical protein
MEMILQHKTELAALLNKGQRMDFTFGFPELNEDENKRWFKKIRENYFSCGCRTGASFVLVAIVLLVTVLVCGWFFQRDMFSLVACLYSFVFVFFAAAAGKATGKIVAYKNLKKDIN